MPPAHCCNPRVELPQNCYESATKTINESLDDVRFGMTLLGFEQNFRDGFLHALHRGVEVAPMPDNARVGVH